VRFGVVRVVKIVRVVERLAGDAIGAVGPARQILELTALAAERPPRRLDWPSPAEYAESDVWHAPILPIVEGDATQLG